MDQGRADRLKFPANMKIKGLSSYWPVALDYSKGLAIPGFAHSGTKAIEQCYAKEFCTTPVEMSFTRTQSRVKVWVGYSAGIDETREVYLIAYDKDGNYVGKARETLTLQGELLPIRTPLEVISKRSNISRAVVSFSLSNIPSEWPIMSHLAVDNVEFEAAGPPPGQKRLDLAILSADRWRFENNALVLQVEIINKGNSPAPETLVLAYNQEDHDWSSGETVPGLNPGDVTVVEVWLHVSDALRGKTHMFVVEIDPEGQIEELSKRNNAARTPEIFIPPVEENNQRPDLATWYIVIFTVFAATIILKYVINKRKPRLPINIETRGGVECMYEPESQQYPVSMEVKGGVERL